MHNDLTLQIPNSDIQEFKGMLLAEFPLKRKTMEIVESSEKMGFTFITLRTNDPINFYRLGQYHAKMLALKKLREL